MFGRTGLDMLICLMSGRPFLWTRQKAGRLSGWRICSGSTRLMDAHPILNGSLKDIDV